MPTVFKKSQLDPSLDQHLSASAPHAGHVNHSLATAAYDFLVASGAGAFVKKTLSETASILRSVLDPVYGNVTWGWSIRSETWTRTGNWQFYVPGDMTTTYRKGGKVHWAENGVGRLGVISSTSYSGGVTYCNMIPNVWYPMTMNPTGSTLLSYEQNPSAFPSYFQWTPTVAAGLTVGNGTLYGEWMVVDGNMIDGFVSFNLPASPSGIAVGDVNITPPVALGSGIPGYYTLGEAAMVDYGVGLYMGEVIASGGALNMRCINAAGTYAVWTYTSATVPFTWGANDFFVMRFKYRF